MVAREELHHLVDGLSSEDQEVLARFLERLAAEQDPVERAFLRASLLEPESLSQDDEQRLQEAIEDLESGRVISHEDLRRELLNEK